MYSVLVGKDETAGIRLASYLLFALAANIYLLGELVVLSLPALTIFNLAAGSLSFSFGVLLFVHKDSSRLTNWSKQWVTKDTAAACFLLSVYLFMLACLYWSPAVTLIFMASAASFVSVLVASHYFWRIFQVVEETKLKDREYKFVNVYQEDDSFKALLIFIAQTVLFSIYISSLAATRDLEDVNVAFYYLGILMVAPFCRVVMVSPEEEILCWQVKANLNRIRSELELEGKKSKRVIWPELCGCINNMRLSQCLQRCLSINIEKSSEGSEILLKEFLEGDSWKHFSEWISNVSANRSMIPAICASILCNHIFSLFLVVSLPLMLCMCETPMEFVLNSMAISFLTSLDDESSETRWTYSDLKAKSLPYSGSTATGANDTSAAESGPARNES